MAMIEAGDNSAKSENHLSHATRFPIGDGLTLHSLKASFKIPKLVCPFVLKEGQDD